MILLGLLDTQNLDSSLDFSLLISGEENERFEKIKNEKTRKQSKFSRLLLSYMYKRVFHEEMPEIFYGKEGKPYFKNEKCAFSISHDENLVAVALTDEEELIGIDLQSSMDDERRKRVEERFLSGVSFPKENSDIPFDFLLFEACNKEESFDFRESPFEFSFEKVREKNDFLGKWTTLEACLKLYGCGFEGLKNVNEYLQKTKVKTLFFQHGGARFALSVAVCK